MGADQHNFVEKNKIMKTHKIFMNPVSMKKFMLIFVTILNLVTGCKEWPDFPDQGGGKTPPYAKKYPADVAIAWINLQKDLIKTTPGFDPLVAARSFAFSGLALYESVVKGMPGYRSVAYPRIGSDIGTLQKHQLIHWPASANAAMSFILKNLFATTSAANMTKIDSLEAAFTVRFQQEKIPNNILSQSAEYGERIAARIFDWSKTDGGHEAYLSAINSDYVPPTGPGLWIPTSPAFPKPIRPYWGNNRSFVPNSATLTLPTPPIAYSETPGSEFYQAVLDLYNKSLSLTEEEITIVKTWGDMPVNYGTSSHYTHIATQLIQENGMKLDQAAVVYAKHGMAIYEATICVFKAKYTYNLIRPVSYIQQALGHGTWSTVIGTPPHPEYPSAHATLGGASYVVLEKIFGKNYAFVDKTHENLYGTRSYNNLREYAVEAAKSRFLGGIHYNFSAEVGLAQGEKVGNLINSIQFKGH
jgi:hypothetical protein